MVRKKSAKMLVNDFLRFTVKLASQFRIARSHRDFTLTQEFFSKGFHWVLIRKSGGREGN